MAVNSQTMNEAEVTYCYEVDQVAGVGQVVRRLPWAFLRFGDTTEARQYVIPAAAPGLALPGNGLKARPAEYMRNRPFPHELDRPAFVNTPNNDLMKPGPLAVHFFNDI